MLSCWVSRLQKVVKISIYSGKAAKSIEKQVYHRMSKTKGSCLFHLGKESKIAADTLCSLSPSKEASDLTPVLPLGLTSTS